MIRAEHRSSLGLRQKRRQNHGCLPALFEMHVWAWRDNPQGSVRGLEQSCDLRRPIAVGNRSKDLLHWSQGIAMEISLRLRTSRQAESEKGVVYDKVRSERGGTGKGAKTCPLRSPICPGVRKPPVTQSLPEDHPRSRSKRFLTQSAPCVLKMKPVRYADDDGLIRFCEADGKATRYQFLVGYPLKRLLCEPPPDRNQQFRRTRS